MKFNFIIGVIFFKLASASEIALETIDTPSSQFTATTAFSHTFQSYGCSEMLSRAVLHAVNTSIESGRLPILVCDIDETLVKRWRGRVIATEFYHNLRDSGAISSSHGVLALTARTITDGDALQITNYDLEACTPEFAVHMRSPKNLDGLISLNFPLETRFLHDAGLLVMGNGGLTKRQVLNIYLEKVLANSTKRYELIVVDNEIGWFDGFCNDTGYDFKITRGHFFHYNWNVGEKVTSPISGLDRLMLAASFPIMRDHFAARDFYYNLEEDDDDSIYDCCSAMLGGVFRSCCPWLYS